MPWACYTGAGKRSGAYIKTHNPFVYFTDVLNNGCTSHVVPYPGVGSFVSQLNSASAPHYVYIAPNLLNDMHDGSVQQGDAWLRANLAPVLAASWFTNFNSTVIVTMDEGGVPGSRNLIPTVIISNNAKGQGAVATYGDHYGTLRTIEEVYGLPMLGGAANGTDLRPLFG
jgi:acid phosphatase